MQLRKIVGGKRYDTETAHIICKLSCTEYGSDFGWHSTGLYRTPKGAWFLAGEGNGSSMWGRRVADGWVSGEGIRPLSNDEAREVLETEGMTAALEDYFEVEDA